MFGFPAQSRPDDFRFTRNLLQSATFQVKYSSATPLPDATGEIISALINIFPVVKHLQRTPLGWDTVGDVEPLVATKNQPKVLQFSSDNNAKAFVVSEDAITMTIAGSEYTNFNDVRSQLCDAIEIVQRIINITSFDRLAIRKINSVNAKLREDLDLSEGDIGWESILNEFFNSHLVAHATGLPSGKSLVSTVVNTRFVDEDDTLNLIYGLSPEEEKDGTRQMLLDIDLFSKCKIHSIAEVRDKFVIMNDEVFDVFMWSIPEKFRNHIAATW